MMQPEDKIQEIAERAERLQEIGSNILRAARDELYLGMRFLDVALSSFSYQMDGQVHGFGTDGRVMYFQPQMLGGLYRENRILVNRGYLHMVFHCIFRHFAWSGTEGKKRADDGITIQERMRDLSCDIAVEHMIDGTIGVSVSHAVFCEGKPTVSLKKREKPSTHREYIKYCQNGI